MKNDNKRPDKLIKKKSKAEMYKTLSRDKILENTSPNYFTLLKDIENDYSKNKIYQEFTPREIYVKKPTKRINESIYNNNAKILGKYYSKNRDDLSFYGSSKYNTLSMNDKVKKIITTSYKEGVIDNLLKDENGQKENGNSKEENVVANYVNSKDKVILTPLAENEKEINKMENLEKENFREAERAGVVMRRIEYITVLHKREFEKVEKIKI